MGSLKDRTEPRQRSLKGGKIIFNNHHSSMDCIINSRSESGFGLKMGSTVGIPDTFELLEVSAEKKYNVEVAWRRPKQLGVKIIEEI